MAGYFKNPKKTKKVINEDGWLHTGDIGIIFPNGCLRIVDRKKNIMKLVNGDYIAPEKIEIFYSRVPYISEAFIEAKSTEEFVIGIFVPDKKMLMDFAKEKKVAGTFEDLCKNEEFLVIIHEHLKSYMKTKKLRAIENVNQFCFVEQTLAELGLLTHNFKLKREKAR